ncbi:hypothetical protein LAh2_23 [Aeromonas phage LAh2]|uniref:Uncharacterized protein n=1 Tax=Aeromonas phage LAh1 TaxID=2591024 RepID=A0A513ZZ34_9CAUD|nr:hypothetical protein LAh1_24 [Aeromonas phage LAh1]QDH46300.1 hypothetical protein LAh2_23 [Aeromonas phage LAh2]QDH46345.1 hypothetical protein LAh3_27 [Aeromonas phage LAh3]QDH46395.1 hypothetical protein LAh4_29 [Aeromonas phage LAh4]QDH46448.1 hypothetical protein LAh5_30 [Aeromonas phage LAh5]
MAKKQFNPSAALGYKRIKPLYDKLQVEVVEQAQVMEELEVGRVLLKTKLEHRVKKCKQAGLRVAELLRLCKAQQMRNETLVTQLNSTTDQLNSANDMLHQYRRQLRHSAAESARMDRIAGKPETDEALRQRVIDLTQRNQYLARKNLELAEQSDKYRGELERIRLRGAYAIIVVGVLALGYALTVIH